MLIYKTATDPAHCRTAIVPPCETDSEQPQGAAIEALALFHIRLRDTLDYIVDFSQWLAANGNAQLADATFATSGDSPSSPTIQGTSFAPSGKVAVVLSVGVEARVGDAYWLDVTAEIGAVAAAGANDLAIPARTLTRRIHVVVVNG